MMLGLVPAVEPLNLLFSAFLSFTVARPYALHPLAIGAAIGFAAMVKETNIALAAVFGLFYLLATRDIVRCLKASAAALSVYSLQLAFNSRVYGAWLFPNRERQWSEARSQGFSTFVEQRYGLKLDAPPRTSLDYLPLNLREATVFYAVPLVALLVASLWLARRRKETRLFVGFCVAAITVFGLFHLGYIRPGATLRYMQAIFPQVFLLLALGLWYAIRPSRASAGAAAPPASAAPSGAATPSKTLGHRGWSAYVSWRGALAAAPAAVAVFALASPDDGSGQGRTDIHTIVCGPQEREPPPGAHESTPHRPVTVNVSRDPKTPLFARVTPTAARHPTAIPDAIGHKGTFRPAEGSDFLAVVYRFENEGRGKIKAGNSVKRTFAARAGGRYWESGDKRCATISTNFAAHVPPRRYTQMLWMGLRKEAAYLPGC